MFYETAQTVGPGWHRSFKPSHYEDMTWSPSSKSFKSPDTSPQTYRRIIHMDDDFPKGSKEHDEDDFFGGRRSPSTLPRRIFKEVWTESPTGHRFGDRPRLFKRVFKPGHWEEEFDKDMPHIRRVERHFDDDRPAPRHFDDGFEKRFSARDFKKDFDEEFEKAEGRVHHIPIMVERRIEEMKSRFGRNSPSAEKDQPADDEWEGPQVQNLRRTFEPERTSSKYSYRFPKSETDSRPRSFTSPLSDSWDPHATQTLPTRKVHKSSQSFDDATQCHHPASPKSVFRSYSETHDEKPPRQQPQHSAAFRSHSDGHCPNQTYVTKIEITMPDKEDVRHKYPHQEDADDSRPSETGSPDQEQPTPEPRSDEGSRKPKIKVKHENPSLQQIAVVLQNVEDLVVRVESYSGTGRDKQYRFLDEMLTRCMLRLDDVETEGREDIRSARKAALREVQGCIDKLEAKAEESERRKRDQRGSSQSENCEKKDSEEDQESSDKKEEPEKQEEVATEAENDDTEKEETKL